MSDKLSLRQLVRIYWFHIQWNIRATLAEILYTLARKVRP